MSTQEDAVDYVLDRVRTIASEAFGPFQVQTPEEALTQIEAGIFNQCRDVERWRSAFGAEAAAHRETQNVLAGTKRQFEGALALASSNEDDLGKLKRKLAQAMAALAAAGIKLPEEPKYNVDWYSCAVCSCKTNEAPARIHQHACCDRASRLGPCCSKAYEHYPENVGSILATTGHAAGCKGGS